MENIRLKGAKNTRDFGGIKNADKKEIKKLCFIRSAALNKLRRKDIQILKNEYALKTVIDLRTNKEKNEKPDAVIDGVNYIHIPIFSEKTAGITHEKNTDIKQFISQLPNLSNLYRTIVSSQECVNQLKEVFKIITENDEGAVLWHCTEGKDRCGIVSAIFLLILDVEKETIYEDYLFTNTSGSKNGERYYKLVRYLLKDVQAAEKIRKMFSAEKEYLDAAFDEIERRYGSTDVFIREQLGITDEVKENMKKKYLV